MTVDDAQAAVNAAQAQVARAQGQGFAGLGALAQATLALQMAETQLAAAQAAAGPSSAAAISTAVTGYGFTADPAHDILVKGSAAPVYVIVPSSMGMRWIPNKGTFEWLGYSLSNVRRLTDSDLSRIPVLAPLAAVPGKGLTFQGSGASIYLVTQGGAKRHIPDMDTFNVLELALADVTHTTDAALAALPDGPPCDHLDDPSWLSVALSDTVHVLPGLVEAAAGFITGNAALAQAGASSAASGVAAVTSDTPDTTTAATTIAAVSAAAAAAAQALTPTAQAAPPPSTTVVRYESFLEWLSRELRALLARL